MFKVRADYDEYQNKTFRIPTELVQELEMVAQANNISVNKIVDVQTFSYFLYSWKMIKKGDFSLFFVFLGQKGKLHKTYLWEVLKWVLGNCIKK